MSISSHSRSSSLAFSEKSSASSASSDYTDEDTTLSLDEFLSYSDNDLKALPPLTRTNANTCTTLSLLDYKPPLLSTTFSITRSTHLHFTSFPPVIPKSTFESLCLDTATSLLQTPPSDNTPTSPSPFTTPQSKLHTLQSAPSALLTSTTIPADLTRHLLLPTQTWAYHSLTHTLTSPTNLSFSCLPRSTPHTLIHRTTSTGVERYIILPPSLLSSFSSSPTIVHITTSIVDRGLGGDQDSVARETLYLEETTEVLCSKAARWWVESTLRRNAEDRAEEFRRRWDEEVRERWERTKVERREKRWGVLIEV